MQESFSTLFISTEPTELYLQNARSKLETSPNRILKQVVARRMSHTKKTSTLPTIIADTHHIPC